MKKSTSLRIYFIRIFIGGVIISIFILGIINSYFINSVITQDVKAKNEQIVHILSSKVYDFLKKYQSLIRFIGDICDSGLEKDLFDYSPYITYLKETNEIIESIYILDDHAVIELTIPYNKEFLGLDMSNQNYVQNLKDSFYWSSAFISYDTGFPTLAISFKTKYHIIVGFINLVELNSYVNMLSLEKNKTAIITDQLGTIVAHKEYRYVVEQVNIQDLQVPPIAQDNKISNLTFTLNDAFWFGSVSKLSEIGWQLYIIEPIADAFLLMTRLTIIFYIGLFLICLVMFGFSFILINRILIPINLLNKATENIQAGIYDFTYSPIKIKELNNLGKTFAKMNLAVQSREIQLMKDKRILQEKESLLQKAIKEKEVIMAQLITAQKMEVIGNLAGGIAHDFNNILMIFFTNLDIMNEKTGEEEPIKKYINIMLSAAERAAALVQQILFISRKTETNKSTVRLIPILKEVINFLQASLPSYFNILLDNHITDDYVSADPTQLHQIFMNLGMNAVQSMTSKEGTISFHVTYRILSVDSKTLAPGKYINIEVKDTGSGIPPDIIDKIFDPFFTTKTRGQGTGLGLATVKALIKQHDGDISVSSSPGEGTSFTILLPLIEKSALEVTSQKFNMDGLTGNESILFVDDEKFLKETIELMIRKQGCTIDAFSSSRKALDMFKKNPKKYDIVITDLTMPELTGEEFIREVRKIRGDIPVILCTGFLDKIKLSYFENVVILIKPFTFKKLFTEIRTILGTN
ncbi:MAG: response regulator [Spirochaetales bacterium]|nr:response regulator [Spirochaetales bacterium]